MNNYKRKGIVDTPSIDNEASKPKATWDAKATELYIKLCLVQVHKGERKGTTLTKKGWRAVISEFNEKTGRKYDKGQFKNKWDNLRKEWLVWYKLFAKETDLKWDSAKNTIDAPDEWWEEKKLENPQYERFRYKGLPFANQLTALFKNAVAAGELALAPSSGILPNGIDENDDMYHMCHDGGRVNLEEGSGDSKEIQGDKTGASVGVSAELQNINLSTSHGNNIEISNGKRKRVGPCDRTLSNKRKVLALKKIANAISRIADAFEPQSTAVVPGTSIGEVMAELEHMEAITSDPHWHSRCCQLMMLKPAREMFVALKGSKQRLLDWLKYAAYNPLPSMKA